MRAIAPKSCEELAESLKEASSRCLTVTLGGNGSKRLMAGPVLPADIAISSSRLNRVLQYERNDLTVSVESGVLFSELQTLLARNGQMIALDPPFSAHATVGGVIASNSSGSLRRGFGTARDVVIGMSFVTLEGKLVKTGGMVVKNVAGLDLGKLMIGSFGTLAAICSVNFRVHSLPSCTKTFLFSSPDIASAIGRRDEITNNVLQPIAIDLISPAAAARLDLRGYVLAVRAGGSRAILDRYARELEGSEQLSGEPEVVFWQRVQEFTSDFLRRQPAGVVVRVSTTLSDIQQLLSLLTGPSISRAGSGVTYVYVTTWQNVVPLWTAAKERNWSAAIEFAPDDIRNCNELWFQNSSKSSSEAFAMMKKVKQVFDPANLLNRARLYGRI